MLSESDDALIGESFRVTEHRAPMGTTPAVEIFQGVSGDDLQMVATDPGLTHHLHEILGGYCHQSRNVLNSLKMSLYLARRGIDRIDARWESFEANYVELERYFDRLQSIYRPVQLCKVRLPFSLLLNDRKPQWSDQLGARGRRLILDGPREDLSPVSFDPVRMTQIFDELVDWRTRLGFAASDLRIHWTVADNAIQVVWDEPLRGPSSTSPSATAQSDSEPNQIWAHDSLVIPLVARVVTLHGGSIRVHPCRPWRLDLVWPTGVELT